MNFKKTGAIFVLLVVGCVATAQIRFPLSKWDASADSGSRRFKVQSQDSWKIESVSVNWIEASQENQQFLKVTLKENKLSSVREGFVIVKDGNNNTARLSVRQQGAVRLQDTYLTVDRMKNERIVSVSNSDGEVSVMVRTDADKWTMEGSSDWCSAVKNADIVQLKYQKNIGLQSRTAVFTVNTDNHSVKIIVNQEASEAKLTVDGYKTDFNAWFDYGGKSRTFFVLSTGLYSVESDAEWISVEKKLDDSFTLTIRENASRNKRNGNVEVQCGTRKIRIEITQDARPVRDIWVNWRGFNDYAMGIYMGYTSFQVQQNADATHYWVGEDSFGGRGGRMHGGQFGVQLHSCYWWGLGIYSGGLMSYHLVYNDPSGQPENTIQGMFNICRELNFTVPVHLTYRLPLGSNNVAIILHGGPDVNWYFGKLYINAEQKSYRTFAPDYGKGHYRGHLDIGYSLSANMQINGFVFGVTWSKGLTKHEVTSATNSGLAISSTDRLSVGFAFLFHNKNNNP